MTDTLDQPRLQSPTISLPLSITRTAFLVVLMVIAGGIGLYLGATYRNLTPDSELLTLSTPYEFAIWVADQSAEEAPPSFWGKLARDWAFSNNQPAVTEEQIIPFTQTLVFMCCVGIGLFCAIASIGFVVRASWTNNLLVVVLVSNAILLLLIPVVENDSSVLIILMSMVLVIVALVSGHMPITRSVAFFIAIASVFIVWETLKFGAQSINYSIEIPQSAWDYASYPTLDDALNALQRGEIRAVFADAKDLETFMPAYPDNGNTATFAYANLRHLETLQREEQAFIFPLRPLLAGRVTVAIRAEDVGAFTRPSQFVGQTVGAIDGDFAIEKYLALPRQLQLLDLKILNDLNLPHLQAIASAFLQPARRNGELLLARILADAGLYTMGEAVFGFVFGALLGLLLGTIFAHIKLLERALLPFVVASQTVPILAIAPMIVIWLGPSQFSVAVIAVYITFFPVTINTLRGLLSPNPTALELMDSYASSWWSTLWKLRFPSALPYIFVALKVSATASVVGAIIGELPSGIGDGLGRAILNFSSDYSLISTPKLWASIITAATVGIVFFVIVSLVERVALRRYVRGV
jgi:NitT/TauT family transport system permease protein